MMCDMSTYNVAFTVVTDRVVDDEQARDVAGRWAAALGYELAMTSTSRDEPWLRVAALARGAADLEAARHGLDSALTEQGVEVCEYLAIEMLHETETQRRGQARAIPRMVNTAELAELAGLSVQRIYQYESERRNGRRTDFPAPVLDGYWLRTVGEHWARTRKTRPGPAPRMS